jgi:hypothetical protein
MTRAHRQALAAIIAVVVLTVPLVGCKATGGLTSAWPIATREREVPRPPAPLRWPLTGLKSPDDASIKRRVLSIKIENSPAARPQTGLNSADVVYETLTEGGITRFNTLWQSTIPKTIGPVRSARLSDLWIVPEYDALFFFSGASTTVNSAVNRAKLPNLSEDAGIAFPYFRSARRPAPHNLYLDTAKAFQEAKKRGYSLKTDIRGFRFDYRKNTAEQTVESVYIPFSQANTVLWSYDPDARKFFRENNGKPHLDAATDKQIAASNVVVMWAQYKPVSRDKVGSTTYQLNLGGSGRVSIFRDGQVFDGTWTGSKDEPPVFRDKDNKPIKLTPGNTWIQVVPLDVNITMKAPQ